MKPTRITVLIGALSLVAALVTFQVVGETTASGAATVAADEEESDGGPAAQAIEKASAAARDSEADAWRSAILTDSALTLLATARAQVINGLSSKDGEDVNRILDSAAWTLDIVIRRVDGEAGESEDAHLDDWVTDAETKTVLHGHLVQARNEVFRSKKDE